MKSKAIYAFLIVLMIFLSGCTEPEDLKLLNWKENAVRLSVINGGATTSFFWKIHFQKNGSKRKRLIFQSISSPYVESISVSGDKLIIHCGGTGKQEDRIEINIRDINDFVDEPVKYRKSILEQTNKSYREPEFIKEGRANDIKYGLN